MGSLVYRERSKNPLHYLVIWHRASGAVIMVANCMDVKAYFECLLDISTHPHFFHGDDRPGTYKNGTEKEKIDFILLSPELYAKVVDGGVERRGVWGGKDGKLFKYFDEITKPVEAASDHAALWAEVSL